MKSKFAWLSAGAVALAFFVWSCSDSKGPTAPEPIQAPAAPATPGASSPATPAAVPAGDSWESNGLRVTVIGDEWGPGACHTNGGTRTFLLENVGDVARYSKLGAYTDDDLVCATEETPTGRPNWTSDCPLGANGLPTIEPGQTCTYAVSVTRPDGEAGVCSVQVDDQWGPGDLSESSHVVGDSFKAAHCSKICVPGEWVEKPDSRKTRRTEWGECPDELQAATVAEACFECRNVSTTWTETNGCDERPAESSDLERREVDCPCAEAWGEWELVDSEPGEWGECLRVPTAANDCDALPAELPLGVDLAGDVSESCRPRCERSRTIVDTFERVEKCTKRTEQRTAERPESEPCDCPETCVLPPEGSVLTWTGRGDPATECAAFDQFGGPFEPGTPADFWICKAGNDREAWFSPPGATCRNGRERSHTVECRCVLLD